MRPKKSLFFMECHIAGRQYHEASEVWDKLTVGAELYLERDTENRYDGEAVAVIFRDPEDEEEYLLGYIPKTDNKTIAMFLEMGYADIFECRLSKKAPDVHYEQQLHVVVKIKRNRKAIVLPE